MAKTRFEQLPKKDREEIQRFVEMRPDINSDTSCLYQSSRDILRNNIAGLSTLPARSGYAYNSNADLFASYLNGLAHQLLQRGIAKRLLADSPQALADSLFAASRLLYLSNLAKSPAYSGSDCQHVFDLLLSIAANDTQAVGAYVRRYDYVAKEGHPFTKLLCNTVRAILTNQHDEALVQKLKVNKQTGHDKAMLSVVAAVIECDAQQVTVSLEEMLAGHRRKTVSDGLLRYFSVPAHALWNLACCRFREVDTSLPAKPNSPLFDVEVQACVLGSESSEYLRHFGIFSHEVAVWARELPIQVPAEAFVLPNE